MNVWHLNLNVNTEYLAFFEVSRETVDFLGKLDGGLLTFKTENWVF